MTTKYDSPIRCFPQTFSLEHLCVLGNSMFYSNLKIKKEFSNMVAVHLSLFQFSHFISSPDTDLLPVMSVSTRVDTSVC